MTMMKPDRTWLGARSVGRLGKSSTLASTVAPTLALTMALTMALGLAACGGGGGGGDDPQPTPGTSALALTADNLGDVAPNGVAAPESVLLLGQLATDEIRRVAQAGKLQWQATCGNGGLADYGVVDADGSGTLSRGDQLVVRYQDCQVPQLSEVVTGSMTLRLDGLDNAARGVAVGRLELGSGLKFATPASPGVTVLLLGSVRFARGADDFNEALSVSASDADDLRVTGSGTGSTGAVVVTDQILRPSVTRSVDYATARIEVSGSLRYVSGVLKGYYDVTVVQPLRAYLDTYPELGRIDIAGANGSRVTLTPNYVVNSASATVALDSNGDGTPETSGLMPWTTGGEGYLWSSAASNWSSSLRSFSTTDFRAQSVPGSNGNVVVAAPLVVQLSRPPAAGTTLSYQLTDNGGYVEYSYPSGGPQVVPVDVVTHGARAVIQPRVPLAWGHSYTLRASSTGSFTDSNTVTVYDDLGNALPFYSGTVASFQTSDTLWLKVTGAGDSALLTTGGALTVSGSAPRSTATVRYRWTQDDGPALTIDTPDAATTTVRLAAAVAGGTGRATLRLTATDASGLSSTTTVPVRLFDLNSVTDRNWVLYYRSEAGDYIGGGQTQVLTDADGNFQSTVIGGNLSASMISPNFSSFWWYFSLATADGSPLTAGNYTGAQRAPFHSANAPGLDFSGTGRGCNTISGNFQVLDIAWDGAGQLQRLAVDFEQHCEGGTPALFGSVRFHSSLPVRP